ncbi:MAG: glycosyltransferase family 39 protein [Desulfamplus sp.]|nr:glycosyltransferase family 39 protein [Desulfamplus sp.]
MQSRKKTIFFLVMILILSLFIRLSYVLTVDVDNPSRADAGKYLTIAINWLDHGIYSHVPKATKHNSFITPGYPLFLATLIKCTPDLSKLYPLILITQAVLSTLTVGLIYLIGLRFMPFAWAAVATAITAISPHAITFSGYILTETLFTFLMVLSIYCATLLLSRKSLWLAVMFAVAAVEASFVRPAFLLFPLFFIIVLFFKSEFLQSRIKITATILVIMILFWMPWQIWQKKHQQPNGENLFIASLALGSYPNLIYKNPALKGFPYREDPESKKIGKDLISAISVIKYRASKEPLKYLYWYTIGKPRMFFQWSILVGQGGPFIYPVKSSIYNHNWVAFQSLVIMSFLHPIFVGLTFLLVIFMLIKRLRRISLTESEKFAMPALMSIFYFAFIHTILAPLPRYSVPLHPLIFICAIFMLYRLYTYLPFKRVDP